MIDLYTWPTSNGQRAAIALEECGLAYCVHRVDLSNGEQRAPAFLAINPAGAIPAIVDPDGPGGAPISLAQSGAIALYAATKSGRFLPADAARRATALQWLFFACADAASASGALFYLGVLAPEKSEPNMKFLSDRLLGILRVADRHLAQHEWLGGRTVDRGFRALSRRRRPARTGRRGGRPASPRPLGRRTGGTTRCRPRHGRGRLRLRPCRLGALPAAASARHGAGRVRLRGRAAQLEAPPRGDCSRAIENGRGA